MADWYVSSAAWTAIAQFAASTAYTVGQIVRPLTAPAYNSQYAFRCTVAGTSSTEPTWPTANNGTVTTGGATFANVTAQSTYGWSAAAGNLLTLTYNGGQAFTSRFTVGDRCFLSSDHVENNNSTQGQYQILNAGAWGLLQFISVNRSGNVPPQAADYLAGAQINYSGTGGYFLLDPYCSGYWQGITFTLQAGNPGGILFTYQGLKPQYLKNCSIVMGTGASSTAAFGTYAMSAKLTLDNTTITFNNVGQGIVSPGTANAVCELNWINTPSAVGGTIPTYLFRSYQACCSLVTCRGVDLSAVTTTLFQANIGSENKILLDGCRIASGVVRLNQAFGVNSSGSDEVELVNCYDGTNFLSERWTPAGTVTIDRSTTMSGGAQDNTGSYATKLVSNAHSDFLAMCLDDFWFDVDNVLVGSSHTATVEIISSASLNNTDIALLLQYLGTSGSGLASFVETLPSALTASAALATSSASWNNPPGTPVTQHLQATFTPQQAGRLRAQVRLGKVSATVWVNPQIAVT